MLVFGIFTSGIFLTNFISDAIVVKTLPNGELTLGTVGMLSFWISIYSAIQSLLWIYQTFQIFRFAPKEIKKPAIVTLIGGIWLSIVPFLIFVTGLHRIIPGLTFLNLAIGSLIVTISLSKQPQLLELLHTISKNVKDQYLRKIMDQLSITEKKLEEKQKQLIRAQKMESIGTLAGGIAHDVNNIFQAVLGNAELIDSNPTLDEDSKTSVKEIISACERGSDIVKQILTVSRKSERNQELFDVYQDLITSIQIFKRTFPKNIQIQVEPFTESAPIFGDKSQIQQVFMNLLINSRDAMPNGGEIILKTQKIVLTQNDCESKPPLTPGVHLFISIRDNGTGMSEETFSHLFEPFYTTKSQGKGTGLGLFIVYSIIKNHQGFIQCYTELGKGTEFKIFLPIYAENTALKIKQAQLPEFPELKGHETILIVDDEDSIRRIAQKLLVDAGYQVLIAENGESALKIYLEREAQIKLIVLDLMMPKMTGIQFIQKLNEMKKIPPKIILSTGFTDQDQEKMIKNLHLDGLLHKPFRTQEMLQMVRTTLDHSIKS